MHYIFLNILINYHDIIKLSFNSEGKYWKADQIFVWFYFCDFSKHINLGSEQNVKKLFTLILNQSNAFSLFFTLAGPREVVKCAW